MYHYGNEEAVGNGIRRSGIDRKELFLVTKVNFKSYDHTRETVEQSMRLLGTDYLDLVLLYWPFADYYRAWRELEALYRAGAVRAIGVSNFEPDRLVDLIAYNEVKPAVDQIETHLYCQRQTDHTWEEKYGAAKYGKSPAQVLLRRTIQDDVTVIPKSVHEACIRENLDVFDFCLTAEEMDALRALDKAAPMLGPAFTTS